MAWNLSTSRGETDFINQQGLGSGGWNWYNYNSSNQLTANAAWLSSTGGLTLGTYSNAYGAPSGGLICPGNVGIGTASPGVPLAVYATTGLNSIIGYFADSVYGSFNFVLNTGVGAYNSFTQTGDALLYVTKGTINTGCITIAPHNSGAIGIRIASTANTFSAGANTHSFVSNSSGTAMMTILGNGNVGIGTASPATALDVFTGTMNAATVVSVNVLVNGSITALTDAIAQGPYLTPSTSNAATILQWMTKTTRTIAVSAGVPPFWSNATSTNSFNTVTGTTNPSGSLAYKGGVLLPDGRVVFVPYVATNVGIFNPATNQFSTVTGTTNPGGNSAYQGGVLLPDGRVVFVPTNATNVGIFNPVTNQFSTVTGTTNPGGSLAYKGGVLLPDGRVVFVPYNATNVGIFDPVANQFSTVTGTTNPGGSSAYIGGVLLPDGRVVFVPANATNVGMLSGSVPAPREFCLSPYYNKL